jgi:ArsR family transcriptional regulator
MLNVLVHSSAPAKAIAEAARVLSRGGDLVVVGLDAHEHEDASRAWGHAQLGVSAQTMKRHLTRAGLEVSRCETFTQEKRAPRFGVVAAFARKP